jgi:hypothetical protein
MLRNVSKRGDVVSLYCYVNINSIIGLVFIF